MPCSPHENLVQSGLATAESNFLLDVDHETLQHRRYKNVFGLGDCCNLPTTKTFWGGFHQVHVVRDNLENYIKGKDFKALYSGYSKSPIFLGQNKMTYMVHYYDQKEGALNLFDKGGYFFAFLRYYFWGKFNKKRFLAFYLHKTWGPPTGKFVKRSFRALPASKLAELAARDEAYRASHGLLASGSVPKTQTVTGNLAH